VSTYVYGILPADHTELPADLTGIGDPPRAVREIAADDICALVSEAPEDLEPKRRDLLAHQSVLTTAGEHDTVLPLRFGSLSPDDEAVRTILSERAGHYRERLELLRDRAEYNVKAAHREEEVLREVLAEEPEIHALNEANRAADGGGYNERLRLGEMVASAIRVREVRDAQRVRNELEAASEAVAAGAESKGWLANLSFLVPRERTDEFTEALRHLERDCPHLELRAYGPLPPYSFVEPAQRMQSAGAPGD
jgi:hypothetical protein